MHHTIVITLQSYITRRLICVICQLFEIHDNKLLSKHIPAETTNWKTIIIRDDKNCFLQQYQVLTSLLYKNMNIQNRGSQLTAHLLPSNVSLCSLSKHYSVNLYHKKNNSLVLENMYCQCSHYLAFSNTVSNCSA